MVSHKIFIDVVVFSIRSRGNVNLMVGNGHPVIIINFGVGCKIFYCWMTN